MIDLSPLADVKTLEFVSVEDTRVTDIGALHELPGLCEVWLYRSSVSDDAGLELGKAVEANGARPRPGITKIVYGP